jgi:cell division protein FtsW (lipid II flippase)
MGIRAYINPTDMATENKKVKAGTPIRLEFDAILFLATITLIIFGSLMVYSASSDFSFSVYGSPTYVFQRQLMWLGLGGAIAFFISFTDYHRWSKFALWIMLAAIVMLGLVLILQEERLGAVRSLFRGSIQPSELAKMVIVVYLSVWLYNRRDQLRDVYFGLIPLGDHRSSDWSYRTATGSECINHSLVAWNDDVFPWRWRFKTDIDCRIHWSHHWLYRVEF